MREGILKPSRSALNHAGRYMVYLTKGAGKYRILSRVRVKLLPREAFKVKKYFPERPPGKSIKILSRVTH